MRECIIVQKFTEYYDGEINERDRQMIENQLSVCPNCKKCYEAYKIAVDICRRLNKEQMPPYLHIKLIRRLRLEYEKNY